MTTKKQIANLAKLTLNELQAKYLEVTGKETRTHNKAFLIRKLTDALRTRGEIEVATAAVALPMRLRRCKGHPRPRPLSRRLPRSSRFRCPSCGLATWK
jgi:hypothetical protein